MRLMASHSPFSGPCFVMASMAYWLQVGVNLQAGGNIGEMQAR